MRNFYTAINTQDLDSAVFQRMVQNADPNNNPLTYRILQFYIRGDFVGLSAYQKRQFLKLKKFYRTPPYKILTYWKTMRLLKRRRIVELKSRKPQRRRGIG